MSIEPEQPSAFLSIWPQSFFSRDCIAAISMDLMAPFTADMGLSPSGIGDLRATIREVIQRDPTVLVLFGANTFRA